MIHRQSYAHLAHIAHTGCFAALVSGYIEGRQKDTHQQGNDCDNYQQLDECKPR
jgi:hypothetical protein